MSAQEKLHEMEREVHLLRKRERELSEKVRMGEAERQARGEAEVESALERVRLMEEEAQARYVAAMCQALCVCSGHVSLRVCECASVDAGQRTRNVQGRAREIARDGARDQCPACARVSVQDVEAAAALQRAVLMEELEARAAAEIERARQIHAQERDKVKQLEAEAEQLRAKAREQEEKERQLLLELERQQQQASEEVQRAKGQMEGLERDVLALRARERELAERLEQEQLLRSEVEAKREAEKKRVIEEEQRRAKEEVGRVRQVYENEQRKVAALESESEKLRAALQARESALTQEKREAERQLLLGLCLSLACRVCLCAA